MCAARQRSIAHYLLVRGIIRRRRCHAAPPAIAFARMRGARQPLCRNAAAGRCFAASAGHRTAATVTRAIGRRRHRYLLCNTAHARACAMPHAAAPCEQAYCAATPPTFA